MKLCEFVICFALFLSCAAVVATIVVTLHETKSDCHTAVWCPEKTNAGRMQ